MNHPFNRYGRLIRPDFENLLTPLEKPEITEDLLQDRQWLELMKMARSGEILAPESGFIPESDQDELKELLGELWDNMRTCMACNQQFDHSLKAFNILDKETNETTACIAVCDSCSQEVLELLKTKYSIILNEETGEMELIEE